MGNICRNQSARYSAIKLTLINITIKRSGFVEFLVLIDSKNMKRSISNARLHKRGVKMITDDCFTKFLLRCILANIQTHRRSFLNEPCE